MIDRCDHGDVSWMGIRESTTTSPGKAVGTCTACGAAVASTLSGQYEIDADDVDEALETEPPVAAGTP